MQKHHIELTDKESALVNSIQLRVTPHEDFHKVWVHNCGRVPELIEFLLERNAIPEARWRYWNDPEYCVGGGKRSHEQIIAGNGSAGQDAYQHLHFLPFLRYILFGSELPDSAIEAFESFLAREGIRPEWFSSGDRDAMWKLARKLTRKYGLVPRKRWAAEEFLKLCLDLGFDIDAALSVRREVMQVR